MTNSDFFAGGTAADADGRDDDFLHYLRRGSDLMEGGRLEEARTVLERAYELNPESAKVQNLLGLTYFKLGLLEAAKSVYDRLITDFPDQTPLRVNLGLVLLRQGRLEEAAHALNAALAIDPVHARAHCYLGLVLYRQGQLPSAREHFLQGDAPAFAEKVEHELERGAASAPANLDLLESVANTGLERLEAGDIEFGAVESMTDENSFGDEGAWETLVGHDRRTGDVERLEEASAEHAGEPSLPAAPDARGAIGVADAGHSLSSNPATDDDGGVLDFEQLGWPIGFTLTRFDPRDARLSFHNCAYVRGSILVASYGQLRISDANLHSTNNPFMRLDGRGRCLVRVPNTAVLYQQAEGRFFVRASALAGFEGEFGWVRGEALGSSVLRLEGDGMVLLNSPRRAVRVEVKPGHPLRVRREAFLAWTDGLEYALLSIRETNQSFITFRGSGQVLLAGPSDRWALSASR